MSKLENKWLDFRNKYRDYFLYFIIIFPFILIIFYFLSSLLNINYFGVIFFGGWSTGYNLYAFLYDKSYISMGVYPADGSAGRYIFAPVYFFMYLLFMFSPFLIDL